MGITTTLYELDKSKIDKKIINFILKYKGEYDTSKNIKHKECYKLEELFEEHGREIFSSDSDTNDKAGEIHLEIDFNMKNYIKKMFPCEEFHKYIDQDNLLFVEFIFDSY